MPPTSPQSGIGRYIVHSKEPGQLAEFIRNIQTEPEVELLDTLGPSGQPHTVVVSMSHEKAQALEQQSDFSKHLTIEPDRPLSLF